MNNINIGIIMSQPFIIKNLGLVDYLYIWQKMQKFTNERLVDSPDEFWVLEHNPVFTLGLAGKKEHMLNYEHNIPVVKSDRGGQATYHGPGQVIIYTLIDLGRLHLSIRQLVSRLEQGMVNYLRGCGIEAYSKRSAPGVYVKDKKIASLGLKIRKHNTYHGISFNAKMDLTPFNYINVCGYSGLKVTQLSKFIPVNDLNSVALDLVKYVIDAVYDLNLVIDCCY